MNSEKKKVLIVLGVLAAILILIPIILSVSGKKGEATLELFRNTLNSSNEKLIFLGRPTCGYCTALKPVLDNMGEEYNFEYEYIDTDTLRSSQMDEILKTINVTSKEFGTPYLLVVKDGKIIDKHQGYAEEDILFEWLQKNKVISSSISLAIDYISYDEYKKLIESQEKSLIVIGQTGCSACTSAKPVLKEIAQEYKINIKYFNISNYVTSTEKQEEFKNSLSFLKEEDWGTPLMLIVQNKKVLANSNGFKDKDTYITFLKENGFIKE